MINKELNEELLRYYFLLDTFEKIIDAIDMEMQDSDKWFLFCSKIGRKHLVHTKSFIFNIIQGILEIEIDGRNISNSLDVSLLYANVRMQLDTYATFHHVFIHDADWDEKIIRFRLWEMDALISRQKFQASKGRLATKQSKDEREQLSTIYEIIQSFDFFSSLSNSKKKRLIVKKDNTFRFANWKFDSSLLEGKKTSYSWKELALNTGIKTEIYSDMHDFTSMHVHANYISILQNIQLAKEQEHPTRMVGLNLSRYITAFFIDDLVSKFSSAKKVIETLNENQMTVLQSVLIAGRYSEHIKLNLN